MSYIRRAWIYRSRAETSSAPFFPAEISARLDSRIEAGGTFLTAEHQGVQKETFLCYVPFVVENDQMLDQAGSNVEVTSW